MKCQSFFWEKKKKNIINLTSANFPIKCKGLSVKQKKKEDILLFWVFLRKYNLEFHVNGLPSLTFSEKKKTQKQTINIKMPFAAAVSSTLRINFAGTLRHTIFDLFAVLGATDTNKW